MSIYLVQPEQLIGTSRYKIGKTENTNLKRLKSYGKCIIYAVYTCRFNFNTLETKLIRVFKQHFKLIAGNEYFEGDICRMKNIFLQIALCDTNNIDIDIYKFQYNAEESSSEDDECSDDDEESSSEDDECSNDSELEDKCKESGQYICELCDKHFKLKTNYIRHQNRKNTCVKEELQCKKCLKNFDSVYVLRRHRNKKKSCENCKYYTCPLCNKQYINKYVFNRHITNHPRY
jgi:hypothetical protein